MPKRVLCYPEGYNVPIFLPATSHVGKVVNEREYGSEPLFGDIRRKASFEWLFDQMYTRGSCVINAITDGESERKRAERFLNNDHVSVSDVIDGCCVPCGASCFADQDVINIMDQSVLTFAAAVGRLPGQAEEMGVIGNGLHCGQNCVAGLAVSRDTYKVWGLSSLLFYSMGALSTPHRQRIGRDTRPLRHRDTEKWVACARQAEVRATNARRIIHVIDREGDRLPLLAQLLCSGDRQTTEQTSPDSRFVIRAHANRMVQGVGRDRTLGRGRVRQMLAQKAAQAYYAIEVKADQRISFSAQYTGPKRGLSIKRVTKRQGRKAFLEVRYLSCRLDETSLRHSLSPNNTPGARRLAEQSRITDQVFTYILVREVNPSGRPLPRPNKDYAPGNTPIEWLLLTTLEVTQLQDLMEVIDIYRHRFPLIEQLFRSVKRDGFNIETAQQASLKTLQIVTAMAMKASALIIKMISARDQDEGYAIEDDFTPQEIEVLRLCEQRYIGNTPIQLNPHPTNQLSWAVWIIARMGGWKPENKKRPPGPKTLQRGLDRFHGMYQGVALIRGWPLDVSQP
jgi:hypothetical protein